MPRAFRRGITLLLAACAGCQWVLDFGPSDASIDAPTDAAVEAPSDSARVDDARNEDAAISCDVDQWRTILYEPFDAGVPQWATGQPDPPSVTSAAGELTLRWPNASVKGNGFPLKVDTSGASVVRLSAKASSTNTDFDVLRLVFGDLTALLWRGSGGWRLDVFLGTDTVASEQIAENPAPDVPTKLELTLCRRGEIRAVAGPGEVNKTFPPKAVGTAIVPSMFGNATSTQLTVDDVRVEVPQ